MARFLASPVSPGLIPYSPTNSHNLIGHIHHPRQMLKTSALSRRNRSIIPRMNPSGTPGSGPAKRCRASNGNGPVGSGGPGFPIPNIPTWARLVLASIVFLALPFYKKILRIEGEVEKDAKAVAEVVEKVAEVTEKIATDVAAAFPGNGRIHQLATEAEHIAEEVEKDAKLAETFIHKVDEIKEEIDTLVDPIAQIAELTIEKKDATPNEDTSEST